jgi:hypothetical protein
VLIIYAVVENRWEDHQASVVELEGIISNQHIYILIVPSSNINYISPQVVEACSLHRKKHVRVMQPKPEIHSQNQINHENKGKWKNNSLLFLLQPNYYNRSSTPYNYYLVFSKTTNFRKTIIF